MMGHPPLVTLGVRETGATCQAIHETCHSRRAEYRSTRRAWWDLQVFGSILAGAANTSLPVRASIRIDRLDLVTVVRMDRILKLIVGLIGNAWRKSFVAIWTAINAKVNLPVGLAAILAIG